MMKATVSVPYVTAPPPWIIEEHNNACFIVKDATGQAFGYFYFEEEPGRRSADVRFKATAVIGCVPSETARSRMTLFDVAAPQHFGSDTSKSGSGGRSVE
jgi:hypothetical protein